MKVYNNMAIGAVVDKSNAKIRSSQSFLPSTPYYRFSDPSKLKPRITFRNMFIRKIKQLRLCGNLPDSVVEPRQNSWSHWRGNVGFFPVTPQRDNKNPHTLPPKNTNKPSLTPGLIDTGFYSRRRSSSKSKPEPRPKIQKPTTQHQNSLNPTFYPQKVHSKSKNTPFLNP